MLKSQRVSRGCCRLSVIVQTRDRRGGGDLALAGIGLVIFLDVSQAVEIVDHQPVGLLQPLADRSPRQLSRSIRAPLLRWKCATGSSARPRARSSPGGIARAQPEQRRLHRLRHRLVLLPIGLRQQLGEARAGGARGSASIARALGPRSADRSPSSGRRLFEPGAEAGNRRQRGVGLEVRQLGGEMVDHALDQEIAEADAGQAALAVGDRIEDRGVGRRRDRPSGRSRRAAAARCRPCPGSAPPRRRSAARPACADGNRRSSAGRPRAGSSGRSSCGSRAPPRSP